MIALALVLTAAACAEPLPPAAQTSIEQTVQLCYRASSARACCAGDEHHDPFATACVDADLLAIPRAEALALDACRAGRVLDDQAACLRCLTPSSRLAVLRLYGQGMAWNRIAVTWRRPFAPWLILIALCGFGASAGVLLWRHLPRLVRDDDGA